METSVALDFLGELRRTHMCGDLRASHAGQPELVDAAVQFHLAARIASRREPGDDAIERVDARAELRPRPA